MKLFILLSLIISLAFSQNIYNVVVGNGTEIFQPNYIANARVGDILSFRFVNSSYNVFQTVLNSCSALPLGFRSPAYPGAESNGTSYNYTIPFLWQGQTIYASSSQQCKSASDNFGCSVQFQYTITPVSPNSGSILKLSALLGFLLVFILL